MVSFFTLFTTLCVLASTSLAAPTIPTNTTALSERASKGGVFLTVYGSDSITIQIDGQQSRKLGYETWAVASGDKWSEYGKAGAKPTTLSFTLNFGGNLGTARCRVERTSDEFAWTTYTFRNHASYLTPCGKQGGGKVSMVCSGPAPTCQKWNTIKN